MNKEHFSSAVFSVSSNDEFVSMCLEAFNYQAKHVAVYRQFVETLGVNPAKVKELSEIPFLPIEFFRQMQVMADEETASLVFSSSGTGGTEASRHFVADAGLYEKSFLSSFSHFYGSPQQYRILALLPSYLEREGSSLVYMMDRLIKLSGDSASGFFMNDHAALARALDEAERMNKKTWLLGVSYALLDFAEAYPLPLKSIMLMETGGMKGRRREMVREELHGILQRAFALNNIHSEYGMTELLSQAYSKGNGHFNAPPWMRVLIRETNDPFAYVSQGRTGGINVIDLANINSCCFIATQDLGKVSGDGSFEVLGRFDNADLRGCNLMAGGF